MTKKASSGNKYISFYVTEVFDEKVVKNKLKLANIACDARHLILTLLPCEFFCS